MSSKVTSSHCPVRTSHGQDAHTSPSYRRNFHIFYMLCDAACSDVAPELHLNTVGLQPSSCYRSLSHDGKPAPVDGKSDLDDFTNLCLTLDRLGVQKAEQRSLYAVLAAILALGNVRRHHIQASSWTLGALVSL